MRFSILGDSISTFEGLIPDGWRLYYDRHFREDTGVIESFDTWWGRVIDHFKGELLVDGSWSGSLVEGSGFPAGCSDERVAALAKGGVEPDVVLVYIGINDFGWGGFDMQCRGRGNSIPRDVDLDALGAPQVAGVASDGTLERFAAAYQDMLRKLKRAYPQAQIWCLTLCAGRCRGAQAATFTDNLRGIPLARYNDAIRAAAWQAGVRVADVALLGLDYECREDGVHPTVRGMQQLAEMTIRAMEHEPELSAERDSLGGVAGLAAISLGSEVSAISGAMPANPCVLRQACVGCDQAVYTGNQWVCACRRAGVGLPAWDALALAGAAADAKLLNSPLARGGQER